ncbi:MAG: hypothetical protein QXW62_02290 [Candidatus Methanomethylicaceae archaeon]|nr:hypothetical protein [Candidatus Verstraetearchaeota archaeon]
MKIKYLTGFVIAMLFTLYASVYAAEVRDSEIVHFWIAIPAGNITKPITIYGAGPPIRMAPLIIDLDERGILKKLIQPNVEAISTHWIYNVGRKPLKIGLKLINANIPIEWEVKANWPYDASKHIFLEPIPPGGRIPNLSIDWYFIIPDYLMNEKVIYDGGLLVYDADTGESLTFIPIKIVRGLLSSGGGSCCG